MDNKLKELQDTITTKTLHHRSLSGIVCTAKFERLWEDSSERDRELVTELIYFGYMSKVKEWIRNHKSLEFGERSICWLREHARVLQIKNWSRLTKAELITEINKSEINKSEVKHDKAR